MKYYHLAEMPHRRAEQYGSKIALKYRDFNQNRWKTLSWRKFAERIMKTAWAMAEIDINEHDRIGIYSQNLYQYLVVDFAAYANKAISVPVYATSSPSQVEYIINDAGIEVLFVGEQLQYNNAYKIQMQTGKLRKLVIFDKGVKLHPTDTTSVYFDNFIASGETSDAQVKVNIRLKGIKTSDIACIIYTSGTTGEPKGVILTHDSFLEVMRIHDIRLYMISDKDVSMCFLPLAHIFEKAWSYYCLHRGMTIAVNQDPKGIQKSIKQIKPSAMCNVPRFWEKVYSGVQQKIDAMPKPLHWLFNDALKTGNKHNLEYRAKGLRSPLGNRIKFFIYNHTVYSLLKRIIGIQNGNIFPCAGAPLSDKVNRFLQSLNIPIFVGYGLSETNATVTCYESQKRLVLHSIGTVMPHLEVKIGENNEILVKGKTLMRGYYKKPEETAKVFTEDGFFRTGDAGYLIDGDILVMTERIKDLFKTANGKYVAPQALETKLCEDPYIDMVTAIGDERKFISALIVPNFEELHKWAEEQEIEFTNNSELIETSEIKAFYAQHIEALQADFASYEKIKRFTLLPEAFSIESGELTNTLKVKRKVVAEKYSEIIEQMYAE
jgi:long-chain acyl-CoA synthetase